LLERHRRIAVEEIMNGGIPTFGRIAQPLAAAGYEPVPIIPGTKRPRCTEWQRGGLATRAQEFANDYTGLLTRNCPGIDIDVSDFQLVADIERIVLDVALCHEAPPPSRIGLPPRKLLLFRTEQPFEKLSTGEFELPDDPTIEGKVKHSKVEILANGQQFVAYAPHVVTHKPYLWNGAGDPLRSPRAKLPMLSSDQALEIVQRADALLAQHATRINRPRMTQCFGQQHSSGEPVATDPTLLREALSTIPNADEHYDEWVAMLLATKAALGDAGLDAFLAWSARSAKHDEAYALAQWRGARPQLRGAGSIYWLAAQHGWRDPRRKTRPPESIPPAPEQDQGPAAADDAQAWPGLHPAQAPPHLCTDLRNAWRIANKHGHCLLFVTDVGWLVWQGTYWRRDPERALSIASDLSRIVAAEAAHFSSRAAKEEDKAERDKLFDIAKALSGHATRCEAKAAIENALALAKTLLHVRVERLDRDPWLFNCANGTLDLRTGELHPHRPENFVTRCVPINYDQNATAPLWLAFLDTIFEQDSELIEFVQRAAGYCLTGSVSEQVLFVLHGKGANGKSVFIGALRSAMGEYSGTAPPELLMTHRGERHPTELADLRGKRLIAAIESGEGRRLNESLIKWLTGGDPIKGRLMRQDFFEFEPTFKLLLATNHKPVIRGTDHAIWRRIRLIPFDVTIPPEKRDQTLPDKLKAEAPGILTWAVQGCASWRAKGIAPPAAVLSATEDYRHEQDVLARFIEEACALSPSAKTRAKDLYARFRTWCQQSGEHLESQTEFGKRLDERGFRRRTSNGVWWHGIGLVDPPELDLGTP
jgi:putative DNA primase/helicase